jgi:hypothetical protein
MVAKRLVETVAPIAESGNNSWVIIMMQFIPLLVLVLKVNQGSTLTRFEILVCEQEYWDNSVKGALIKLMTGFSP